jgi:hypothetical protein
MDSSFQDRVRERAYFVWLDAGGAGPADRFWLQAEREILAESVQPAALKPRAKAKAGAPKQRKKAA